jgi:transcriptional regulator of arginine metabolism
MHTMRTRRHQKIRSLLRDHVVESQESLQKFLQLEGIEVNQATLSRDLRRMGVIKQRDHQGQTRYQEPTEPRMTSISHTNLQAFVQDVVCSGNLMVVKTRVGGAQPVALAMDQLGVKGIIGTIAGDDTVLGVIEEGVSPREAVDALWTFIEHGQRSSS